MLKHVLFHGKSLDDSINKPKLKVSIDSVKDLNKSDQFGVSFNN